MNKSKFNPNRYKQEKDRIPREAEFAMTSLCCRRCCEIIQWKVDYGKYTPQEQSRRCNCCHEKKVVHAYHRICQNCAEREAACAKCQKQPAQASSSALKDVSSAETSDEDNATDGADEIGAVKEPGKYAFVDVVPEDEELQRLAGLNTRVLQQGIRRRREAESREVLAGLRERERRTALRKANAHDDTSDSDVSL